VKNFVYILPYKCYNIIGNIIAGVFMEAWNAKYLIAIFVSYFSRSPTTVMLDRVRKHYCAITAHDLHMNTNGLHYDSYPFEHSKYSFGGH
jgi:hypothetical protein